MREMYPTDGHWPDEIDDIRDNIKKGHKKWGFAIYRCTYDDENAWEQLLTALRRDVSESLAQRGADDLVETFELDIREDRNTLQGASPDKVREIFRECVFTKGQAECPESEAQMQLKHGTPEQVTIPSSARYLYCVHIDAEALASVVARLSGAKVHAWVNLVDGLHKFISLPVDSEEVVDEDDLPLEGYEEGEKPLGYMRVGFFGLMPGAYGSLNDGQIYDRVCRNPPEIWMGDAYYASDDVYQALL